VDDGSNQFVDVPLCNEDLKEFLLVSGLCNNASLVGPSLPSDRWTVFQFSVLEIDLYNCKDSW
jgi:hypothetical protein